MVEEAQATGMSLLYGVTALGELLQWSVTRVRVIPYG
jgi:hypothetical protein